MLIDQRHSQSVSNLSDPMLKCPNPGANKGRGHNPYYIVTPPYVRTSAGVKALHLLCDTLRQLGEEAYLVISPMGEPGRLRSPDLATPILERTVMREHHRSGRTPITVYPETIRGNAFKAPLVARYILNYPGLLGGDAVYDPAELCFGYSRKLAESGQHGDQVLFLPTSDPRTFYPPPADQRRSGTCFYASKYKEFHGGELLPITRGSIEITRDKPDSHTPAEIADLFRSSELFYCYENTALATEAVMCGCPAVFLPNKYLTEIIGIEELGSDGFAWGASPEEISRAKATVGGFFDHYLQLIDGFWGQLDRFVELTQKRAAEIKYTRCVQLHWEHNSRGLPRIAQLPIQAIHIAQNDGLAVLASRCSRFIGRRLKRLMGSPSKTQ